MFETKYRSYCFGAGMALPPDTLERLIELFRSATDEKKPPALEGRRAVTLAALPELGHVAVKHYARGGAIRFVNRHTYLNLGLKRSKAEFEYLMKARACGAAAPEPLVYASRGSVLYRAWLVTRAIAVQHNFMRLCADHTKKAVSLLPDVCENIRHLVRCGIYHVDLHPGNILVDHDDRTRIVDFDKACFFSGSKEKLARFYTARWKRAARKYGLPDSVSELNLTGNG